MSVCVVSWRSVDDLWLVNEHTRLRPLSQLSFITRNRYKMSDFYSSESTAFRLFFVGYSRRATATETLRLWAWGVGGCAAAAAAPGLAGPTL